MIRLLIIAGTHARAQQLADQLSDESEIEILHAGTVSSDDERDHGFADVVLAAGLDDDLVSAFATPTVALARSSQEPHWPSSVRAWLPPNTAPAEILAAIRSAAQDLTILTRAQAARWLPAEARLPAFEEQLTPREVQVLRMLADGLGNKEIAGKLHISEHTAKSHVGQILAKLRAGSRAEAVALGMKRGLVPI